MVDGPQLGDYRRSGSEPGGGLLHPEHDGLETGNRHRGVEPAAVSAGNGFRAEGC